MPFSANIFYTCINIWIDFSVNKKKGTYLIRKGLDAIVDEARETRGTATCLFCHSCQASANRNQNYINMIFFSFFNAIPQLNFSRSYK